LSEREKALFLNGVAFALAHLDADDCDTLIDAVAQALGFSLVDSESAYDGVMKEVWALLEFGGFGKEQEKGN
jgi:hypothetical protein